MIQQYIAVVLQSMSKVCKFIQIEKIKGFDVLALQSVWDVLAIAGCDSPSLHISFIFSSTAEMPTAPIQVDLYLQKLFHFNVLVI